MSEAKSGEGLTAEIRKCPNVRVVLVYMESVFPLVMPGLVPGIPLRRA
jgi:hypothetical protein